SVPTRVQKDMEALLPVPGEDDRLLAHARDEVIAGLADLALVSDEEPTAGEEPFLLLLVQRLVHEELAADESSLHVDERLHRVVPGGAGHDFFPHAFIHRHSGKWPCAPLSR